MNRKMCQIIWPERDCLLNRLMAVAIQFPATDMEYNKSSIFAYIIGSCKMLEDWCTLSLFGGLNFDNTTIADRLWTVSWSNDSLRLVWLNRLRDPDLLTHRNSSVIKRTRRAVVYTTNILTQRWIYFKIWSTIKWHTFEKNTLYPY